MALDYEKGRFTGIDNYAKNGEPGAVWTSSSFNHNPLRH